MDSRPASHSPAALLAAWALWLMFAPTAAGVERVTITVQSLRSPMLGVSDLRVDARLDVAKPMLTGTVSVGGFVLPGDAVAQLKESRLALPPLSLQYRLAYGARDAGWQIDTRWENLPATTVYELADRYLELPPDISVEGALKLELEARGSFAALNFSGQNSFGLTFARGNLRLADLSFSNEAGDLAGENLALEMDLAAQQRDAGFQLTLYAFADRGAALAGPVFLEVGSNPLEIAGSGLLVGRRLQLQSATLTQEGLIAAHGTGQLSFAENLDPAATRIDTALLTLERLQFPGAYASLMQTALAGSILGALETRGEIGAELELRDNSARRAQIELRGLGFRDKSADRLRLEDLDGTLHWHAANDAPPPNSTLRWQRIGAYGLDAQAASLALSLHGTTISLTEPFRLPILDGALRTDYFLLKDPATAQVRLEYSGELEPISMPALARTFGWPEFPGTIRSRIPSVAYADKVLRFDGDVSAEIFGGQLVGRNITLADPLGRWPRFTADIQFDNFDLEAVTQTFEVGTITGKLEGRIEDLELFAWSPVSFDALIRTPPNDRSRHRISVKAINSVANVGGNAGSGVATALQGGMLRFFSSYGYKRLTLRCRLQNDVCLMSGEGKEDDRYYLLEGRGLPRVDIFGYSGRVRWSQLVQQIRDQIETGSDELRIEY